MSNYPEVPGPIPVREIPTRVILGRLENKVSALQNEVQALAVRVSPVMSAQLELNKLDPLQVPKPEYSSPLLQELNARIEELDTVLRSVRDILQRLEI
jgi:hypothetical protein